MTSTLTAGQPADPAQLVNIDRLIAAYYEIHADPSVPSQRVAFGTSGHRGSAFNAAFNEDHILAVVEATCRYRAQAGIDIRVEIDRRPHDRIIDADVQRINMPQARVASSSSSNFPRFLPTPMATNALGHVPARLKTGSASVS